MAEPDFITAVPGAQVALVRKAMPAAMLWRPATLVTSLPAAAAAQELWGPYVQIIHLAEMAALEQATVLVDLLLTMPVAAVQAALPPQAVRAARVARVAVGPERLQALPERLTLAAAVAAVSIRASAATAAPVSLSFAA